MKATFALAVVSATILNLLFAWTSHALGPLGEWFTYLVSKVGIVNLDYLSVFLICLFIACVVHLGGSKQGVLSVLRAFLWGLLVVLPLPVEVAFFDSGELGMRVMTVVPMWLTNVLLLPVCAVGTIGALGLEVALRKIETP